MGWLRDILLGKPTDDEVRGQGSQASPAQGAQSADAYHQASGAKVIPEVIIDHVESHCSADMVHLELWIRFKNTSSLGVEITRAEVLGQSTSPSRYLKPSENHEYCAYKGLTPTTNGIHVARLGYKIVGNGDYFEADFQVIYRYEEFQGHKLYIPDELHLIRPIRDR